MVGEEEALLSHTAQVSEEGGEVSNKELKTVREVSVSDLAKARNAFFVWTFFGYLAFGVLTELYSNLFFYVIDKNHYSKASFYSTLAMTLYSVVSFFLSPIASTMSDTLGRKPIFVIAALTDCVSGILLGLVPSNWMFISMMMLQGGGDNSMATGYSLLADYVVATPKGHAGSKKDSWMGRLFYRVVRAGASEEDAINDEKYMEKELSLQYTVILIIQTCGLLIGVVLGDLLYYWTDSYSISVAFSGFICAPMVVYIYCFMPETVPESRRKPFSMSSLLNATTSQLDSVFMFMGNHRLWGLAFVNFLIQFASAGVFDVVLYWGEWKFGWGTDLEAIALYVAIFSGIVGAVLLPRLMVDRGFQFSHMIGGMCIISAVACIPCGLSSNNVEVMFSLFLLGVGFGALPAISSQIANEASVEDQGRVNGFNYAVSTLAWAIGPYAYWYMYDAYVDDDDSNDGTTYHPHNIASSMLWWVSGGVFLVAGAVTIGFVGDSDVQKLKHTG